jgi:aspartyl-tRNA(Asn)/glutamyl-tRNA(Gln) amidotransferase subunit A
MSRFPTMAETAEKLRERATDPIALCETALRQSLSVPSVFISLTERVSEYAAQAADRWRRGAPLSRFDGIPFAVKDMIDVAGSRTTCGSSTRRDVPAASRDAAVIASLRAAGMVPIGKTNLSEFAFSGLGLNPHFGTPTAHIGGAERRAPGGSSSGSAIAVQRGLVSVAIGTDTAGSVRVPAAFNGLIGFRASRCRYDLSGVHPLAVTLDTLGPIARTVLDCVLLDGAMRGCPDDDAAETPLEQARFIVDASLLSEPALESDVRANWLSVANRLREHGMRVEARPIDALLRARRLIATQGWLGAIEARRLYRREIEGARAGLIDPRVRHRLLAASDLDSNAERCIRVRRAELMSAIARELDDAILITPTVKHVAPPLAALEADEDLFARFNLETLSLTMPGSLLDMPGVAMPSGVDRQGLPTSVLFSAPQGHDTRLLRICLAVESALLGRGSSQPPNLENPA